MPQQQSTPDKILEQLHATAERQAKLVDQARTRGATATQIGAALNATPQAIAKRFPTASAMTERVTTTRGSVARVTQGGRGRGGGAKQRRR